MSNLFNNPDNLVDMVRQVLSGKPIEEKEQKVAAYDKKGKQVGLYKNMADAKKLKPGHTYKPHKEELDPVGKEDGDIDNDGDTDASDKYLKKRRKAISKAINEKDPKKKINASHCEEVELDEANPAKMKDDDGEEKTAAQKSDPDGDGKADGDGKKKPVKKKKKKEEGDDEKDNAEIGSNKPDVVDTKPSIETSSMVSEAEGSVKIKSGPDHDRKLKRMSSLANKLGLKVNRTGKSDDGKMTTLHLQGDQKKILDMQSMSKLDEDKQELGKISKELDGASKTHKGQSDRIRAILKKKEEMKEMTHDDNEKDTNLIMQLRKAISLRGHTVTFKSGKEKVSPSEAQAFIKAYSALKKPAEKEFMMKYAMKSKSDMKSATMGKYKKPGKGGLDLPKMKSER